MKATPQELRERDLERKRKVYAANPDKYKARMKLWREKHPDRALAIAQRWRDANPGKVAAWFAEKRSRRSGVEAGHRCPVCGTDRPGAKGWVRDHDHRFSRWDEMGWREILCHGCNIGVKLTDSISLLLAKAEYLRKHTARLDEVFAARKVA
jgi:Recombination endonuclease VII